MNERCSVTVNYGVLFEIPEKIGYFSLNTRKNYKKSGIRIYLLLTMTMMQYLSPDAAAIPSTFGVDQ